MDNLTLLTEGSKIYSEKRKRKNNQIPEIVFDENARREYLTGFHKRKLERQAKAKKIALERVKKEKAEIKKAAKEAQKRQIEEKLAATQAMINKANDIDNDDDDDDNSGNDDDDGNNDDDSEEDTKKNPQTRIFEYKTPQILTTVTVIEDFNVSESTAFGNLSKKIKLDNDDKMNKNEGDQDIKPLSKIKNTKIKSNNKKKIFHSRNKKHANKIKKSNLKSALKSGRRKGK